MSHQPPHPMTAPLPGALRRAMPLALAALVLSFITGCAVLEPEPQAADRRELARARALWQRQGLASYRFEYSPRCGECPPSAARAVVVTVDAGVVVEASYVDSYEPVNTNPYVYGTVDSLFAVVQRAYDQRAYSVRVRYDATRGFPTDVWVDWRADVIDEESGFAVSAFVPYRPEAAALR